MMNLCGRAAVQKLARGWKDDPEILPVAQAAGHLQ